jgi:hypothetical protein
MPVSVGNEAELGARRCGDGDRAGLIAPTRPKVLQVAQRVGQGRDRFRGIGTACLIWFRPYLLLAFALVHGSMDP